MVQGFRDESALLKHELAYCLGQIKRESALLTLEEVLRDTNEDAMVRHEVCISMCMYLLENTDKYYSRLPKLWALYLPNQPYQCCVSL